MQTFRRTQLVMHALVMQLVMHSTAQSTSYARRMSQHCPAYAAVVRFPNTLGWGKLGEKCPFIIIFKKTGTSSSLGVQSSIWDRYGIEAQNSNWTCKIKVMRRSRRTTHWLTSVSLKDQVFGRRRNIKFFFNSEPNSVSGLGTWLCSTIGPLQSHASSCQYQLDARKQRKRKPG